MDALTTQGWIQIALGVFAIGCFIGMTRASIRQNRREHGAIFKKLDECAVELGNHSVEIARTATILDQHLQAEAVQQAAIDDLAVSCRAMAKGEPG